MTISCPDDEVCTHSCDRRVLAGETPRCYRIGNNIPPAIGRYPGDQWPPELRRQHGRVLHVVLPGVPIAAAVDVLLAIEGFAGRAYADRSVDPEQQAAYNRLASVVLPIREAVDALSEPPQPDDGRLSASLIEDEDGAPLPVELQRDSPLYATVLGWLTDPGQPIARYEVEEWPKRTTDDLMARLAPLLWPLLPSNDASAAARGAAVDRFIAEHPEMLTSLVNGPYAPIAPDQTSSVAAADIVDPRV